MRRTSEQGAILIVVLWLTVILSITAAGLAYARRTEIHITRNQMERSKAYAIARGGVEIAIGVLHEHGNDKTHAPTMDWWSSSDRYERVAIGEGHASIHSQKQSAVTPGDSNTDDNVGLADMESKLNVNVVPEKILSRLKGLSPEIAAAIIRKREELIKRNKPSSSLVTTIAEAREEKERQTRKVVNTPFRLLRDLLQVGGVTEAMLYGDGKENMGLSQFLTTQSCGTINIHSASKEVLMALGVKEKLYPKIEQKISNGKGFSDIDQFLDVSGLMTDPLGTGSAVSAEEAEAHLQRLRKLLALRSSNFSLISIGQGALGMRAAIHATLSIGKDVVRVTSWRCTWLPPAEISDASTVLAESGPPRE